MNHKLLNEGFIYTIIGIAFILATLGFIFPIIMCIMKFGFYFIGAVLIYNGIDIMIKSKKRKNEN